MQVGRGQVDHNFPAGDVKSFGLQGRHRAQQAFLDGGIGQTDEMDAHAQRYVHFHRYRHGLDAQAFGRMDVYYHNLLDIDSREIPVEADGCLFFVHHQQMFAGGHVGEGPGKDALPAGPLC